MGRGLSVGQATLARLRSLFLACVVLVDTARQDGKTATSAKKHVVPDMLGQVSSSLWV